MGRPNRSRCPEKWFFPTAQSGPEHDVAVERAKWVCGGCSVRAECLTDALARIPNGIAGGVIGEKRRAVRRSRQKAAAIDGQRHAAPDNRAGNMRRLCPRCANNLNF
jgi:Transcription factor WhiB